MDWTGLFWLNIGNGAQQAVAKVVINLSVP